MYLLVVVFLAGGRQDVSGTVPAGEPHRCLRGSIRRACPRWSKWGATPLAVSLAAQLSTAPLILSAFGQISLVATAANLVVVPLMIGSVGVGLMTVLIGGVSRHPAVLLNGSNRVLLETALGLSEILRNRIGRPLRVLRPLSLVCGFALLLVLGVESIRQSRFAGVVVCVVLTAANVHVWAGSALIVIWLSGRWMWGRQMVYWSPSRMDDRS